MNLNKLWFVLRSCELGVASQGVPYLFIPFPPKLASLSQHCHISVTSFLL